MAEIRRVLFLRIALTPLASGYSPAELVFGRPVATPLGNVGSKFVDYKKFEGSELSNKFDTKLRWDKKHS